MGGRSFPLDGPRRLRRYVVNDPVDPRDLIDHPARDVIEKVEFEDRGVGPDGGRSNTLADPPKSTSPIGSCS